MTASDAEDRLRNEEEGTFLVRLSESRADEGMLGKHAECFLVQSNHCNGGRLNQRLEIVLLMFIRLFLQIAYCNNTFKSMSMCIFDVRVLIIFGHLLYSSTWSSLKREVVPGYFNISLFC